MFNIGKQFNHVKLSAPVRKSVDRILSLSESHRVLSDTQLASAFSDIRCELPAYPSLTADSAALIQAMALVREASRRALSMAHYDVQLAAGIVMATGGAAELATGEGKTLVATLPAAVFALYERSVHVMTVNSYLAERDCQLMSPIYELLGLSVDYIDVHMDPSRKRQAYAKDIVYGVGSNFGFDYLRDQIHAHQCDVRPLGGTTLAHLVGAQLEYQPIQVERAFAVIDEADSVMLDEAGSNLILSAASDAPHPHPELYLQAYAEAADLEEGEHFRTADGGLSFEIAEVVEVDSFNQLNVQLRSCLVRGWSMYLANALKALHYFNRDEHYLVVDGKLQIIDQNTGRRFSERTWSQGLHQAVEAKEGITITTESRAQLSMPRQHFFKLYDGLAGMSGTFNECERELNICYAMRTSKIPPHKANKRKLLPAQYFETKAQKFCALIDIVKTFQARGNPILIGTRTVKDSEILSQQLFDAGIVAQTLNAKRDSYEAQMVSKAGRSKCVTIATSMAGRGTDIPLSKEVKLLGGLLVIISEPHYSYRVDRQLIGRCARCGDPGMAIYLSSLDDAVFDCDQRFRRRFQQRFARIKSSLGVGAPRRSPTLDKMLRRHQNQYDFSQFQNRLNLLRHNELSAQLFRKLA